MILTVEQILALAPDAASAKAGSGQSSLANWSGLGGHEQALWGLCQGSGKEPYRAQIELAGPAFKCTCPSRKFPCKHGLGLYLLYQKERAAFADTSAPVWVSDWLQSREQRIEKKAAKLAQAEAEQSPEDIAAKALGQQKRQEKRQDNVANGIAVLDTWLADLAREGLAGLRSKPARDWEAMAARQVDAQASGLANRIRRAGMLIYGSNAGDWELAVARELAQLALLSQSHKRLERLPAGLQYDVKMAIGWTASQEEALAEPGQSDLWQVCGNHTQDDARVSRRACYLRGLSSGRWAMFLQFSAGAQALAPPLLPGACYQGTLHFYPSASPLRAVFADGMQLHAAAPACESSVPPAAPSITNFTEHLSGYAHVLAANPFVEAYPMLLEQVTSHYAAAPVPHWSIVSADGAALPVASGFRQHWQLHALAGTAPVSVFGVWNGYAFLPLALSVDTRVHSFDAEPGK